MDSTLKRLGFVSGGIIIGGAIGYLLAEKSLTKKYALISDEEIASVKAAYQKKEDELNELVVSQPGYFEDEFQNPTTEEALASLQEHLEEEALRRGDIVVTETEVDDPVAVEEDTVLSNILNAREQQEPKVPYHTYSESKIPAKKKKKIEIAIAEEVTIVEPIKAGPVEDEPFFMVSEEYPYGVSADEHMEDEPDFQKITLVYYEGDDVLADDMRDLVLDNRDELIGNRALGMFGRRSKDGSIVYVRNKRLAADFEVIRNEGSYKEIVQGQPAPASPFSKNRNEG